MALAKGFSIKKKQNSSVYAKKDTDANKTQVPGVSWALSLRYQILSTESNMEEKILSPPSLTFPF
jgi:hypothetical protein